MDPFIIFSESSSVCKKNEKSPPWTTTKIRKNEAHLLGESFFEKRDYFFRQPDLGGHKNDGGEQNHFCVGILIFSKKNIYIWDILQVDVYLPCWMVHFL